MENNDQEQGVPADLLALATKEVKGETLTQVNPFERPPLMKVGKDWLPGVTVSGYYAETIVIPTPKSKYASEANAHILRVGSPTGKKLGIWSVGELGAFFESVQPGTLVSITYKSKGENAEGNKQHFFEFRRGGLQ